MILSGDLISIWHLTCYYFRSDAAGNCRWGRRMSRSSKKKRKDLTRCTVHQDRRAKIQCQSCHEYYCSECIEEVWEETRLVEQALGRKKEFTSKFLCKKCERKSRILRVLEAAALLILFLIPVFLYLLGRSG